ncbi:MAG TPA: M20/M25/M40 family metallo-hydrolase [Steroidobacteraceae bacterium]|nr:M20/M25/M40 family metallo-hydrolase [Steroidobacteraceae bacterium]
MDLKWKWHGAVMAACCAALGAPAGAAPSAPDYAQLARDVFRQLVEIDTTQAKGTTVAANAMAQRFRDAGFPDSDIHVLGANASKQNLVVRLHGTGRARPILLMGHLDVVDAARRDWDTDPFRFVTRDGFYYGRGTQDMKDGDAIYVTTLIHLKQQGYRGDRDLILALTADEEAGDANGIDWLFKHQRPLVDAEFALNHDGPGVMTRDGRPVFLQLEASEKTYADFELTVLNPGGHSSEPAPVNAIYQLSAALGRLSRAQFPFELNDATRAYFEWDAKQQGGEQAADIRAMLATPPDPAAIARVSRQTKDNALVHTTCVATRFNAGEANNALPTRAQAIVNCRILPGHEPEQVRQELIRILAEPALVVKYVNDFGVVLDDATSKHATLAAPLRPDVMRAAQQAAARFWPGMPVIPMMEIGSSDAVFANEAGLPVYQLSGDAVDRDDNRMHGRNERIGIAEFDRAVQFYYQFMSGLTARAK